MKHYMLMLFFSIATFGYAQEDADKIIGKWSSEVKGGDVQIYKTSKGYFGKMVRFSGPGDAKHTQVLDVNNPDTLKSKLPLVGLVFLSDFRYDARHKKWWGKLYDYDGPSGKTFNSYLQFNNNGTLNLTGYRGRSWMSLKRTTVLTRIIED